MLKAGIVGLPNVGKSTLFNAVTRTRKAEAANYPFCTIDPNVGIVTVPDSRLEVLKNIAKTTVVIPAAVEFVDIAGLVKGAGEGHVDLGEKRCPRLVVYGNPGATYELQWKPALEEDEIWTGLSEVTLPGLFEILDIESSGTRELYFRAVQQP